jgi:hypothetical protein
MLMTLKECEDGVRQGCISKQLSCTWLQKHKLQELCRPINTLDYKVFIYTRVSSTHNPKYRIYLSVYGSTALCWSSAVFQFLNPFTQSVWLLGWGISPSQGRYLHTGQHKHRIHTMTSILQVRFEPKIPAFEKAKTVHVLDCDRQNIGSEMI